MHGDYRLDNMLFSRPGSLRELTVVDWQTVTWGPAPDRRRRFLGCVQNRRPPCPYDDLLAAYHNGLGPTRP